MFLILVSGTPNKTNVKRKHDALVAKFSDPRSSLSSGSRTYAHGHIREGDRLIRKHSN